MMARSFIVAAVAGVLLFWGGNSLVAQDGEKKEDGEIPPNCYAARVRDREAKARKEKEW